MKNTHRRRNFPMSLAMGTAAIGVAALIAASVVFPGSAQADGHAELSLSASEAMAGDTVTVMGSGFRMGTEASFIYTSTITVGGMAIASVSGVDASTAYLHAGRTTDSGLYIAEHIDIDPAGTDADGAFSADIVLPDLAAGTHELMITSCWGGPDDAYPEDDVAPCGTKGMGGGVNDVVATASITIK